MEICDITLAGFGICKIVGYPILFFLGIVIILILAIILEKVLSPLDWLLSKMGELFSKGNPTSKATMIIVFPFVFLLIALLFGMLLSGLGWLDDFEKILLPIVSTMLDPTN